MKQFKASNGVTVAAAGIDPAYLDALREFFQHERDEALGRWRSAEYPDFAVYAEKDGVHMTLDERTGQAYMTTREGVLGFDDEHAQAARAYFAAHPEPKPWHDAKPGEVWVLGIKGSILPDEAYQFTDGRFRPTSMRAFWPRFEDIATGRRIWPEAD